MIPDAEAFKVAKKIAKLTDENFHTLSILALANLLGEKRDASTLEEIQRATEAGGQGISSERMARRDNIRNALLALAQGSMSPAAYEKIHNAF